VGAGSVHDVTASGRSIRVLNVVDAYTRESCHGSGHQLPGLRVTRVLDEIIAERGLPHAIRCDNGPELTSRHFLAWALDSKIDLVHIQPGKLTQNAYVESFNSKLREECPRVSWFQNLFEARRIIANWRRDYNERRPPSSLNYLTPAEFAAKSSRGKDTDSVRFENATSVPTLPPLRRRVNLPQKCAESGGRPLVHSPIIAGPTIWMELIEVKPRAE